MSAERQRIWDRRARLVERAAIQRDEFSRSFEQWSKPLGYVDRGMTFLSSLRKRAPLLSAGLGIGLAVLAIARPLRLTGWVERGAMVWRTFRTIRAMLG